MNERLASQQFTLYCYSMTARGCHFCKQCLLEHQDRVRYGGVVAGAVALHMNKHTIYDIDTC